MALMDKFLNYMKLNDDPADDGYYDEEEEDYYDDEEEEYEEAPVKQSASRRSYSKNTMDDFEEQPATQATSKVTPMRPQGNSSARRSTSAAPGNMEVCVIRPVSIEDAKEITDTLRAERAVVLNLEGLNVDIAQRIIDFASGSSYAIDGKLQKISHSIFIITPRSVDISGDFQDGFPTESSVDVPGIKPLR